MTEEPINLYRASIAESKPPYATKVSNVKLSDEKNVVVYSGKEEEGCDCHIYIYFSDDVQITHIIYGFPETKV